MSEPFIIEIDWFARLPGEACDTGRMQRAANIAARFGDMQERIAALSRPAKDVEGLVGRLSAGADLMRSIANGYGYGEGMDDGLREHFRLSSVMFREAAAALKALARERDEVREAASLGANYLATLHGRIDATMDAEGYGALLGLLRDPMRVAHDIHERIGLSSADAPENERG